MHVTYSVHTSESLISLAIVTHRLLIGVEGKPNSHCRARPRHIVRLQGLMGLPLCIMSESRPDPTE
ncbi:hypothetical protein C8Q74DRAFT_595331 [Fomes fomentarius]|nr:hypothetical protein C8Q74DRAFT_595331 [Fomes fomentarius]